MIESNDEWTTIYCQSPGEQPQWQCSRCPCRWHCDHPATARICVPVRLTPCMRCWTAPVGLSICAGPNHAAYVARFITDQPAVRALHAVRW